MVNSLNTVLSNWIEDPQVEVVAVRGCNSQGPFGAFCAGGDIRFFHDAAIAGHRDLGAFFTAIYHLSNRVFNYPKPYVAFMDGVVMGGGMALVQGTGLSIVSERTKLAMPETNIGFFPDVGGGYFLSRCRGALGEYLALTGQVLKGGDALAAGLANALTTSASMPDLWAGLTRNSQLSATERYQQLRDQLTKTAPQPEWMDPQIDRIFNLPTVSSIIQALEQADNQWAANTLQTLRRCSPLMLHVIFEQIRRGRGLSMADELRMERNMAEHCFDSKHLDRSGINSETVEGIRALVVDKDQNPKWNPARIEDITPEMVAPFFESPWPENQHPLADLK
jgi:enoyl-CoA hydratase/carnithine racemase